MKKYLVLFLALLFSYTLLASIRLPSVLGDGAVLQRNSSIELWGWAEAGSKISVVTSWDGKKYKTKTSDEGRWKVNVFTTDAGGPYYIIITGNKTIKLNDILLGEVWICGGQSNMEMPVGGFIYQPIKDGVEHIVSAFSFPQIRMFTVPRVVKGGPQEDCDGEWKKASPENVRDFSAVGYFFGKALTQCLPGIPIGLISMNWGGSDVSTWMTKADIEATQGIDHHLAMSGKDENTAPSSLYENMLLPISRYKAKGFIWYQGETNRYNWFNYKELLKSMVKCWRRAWNDENMPFYQVQLAPHEYDGCQYRSIGVMNEAQFQASLEIPFSGIVATIDLGGRQCIHPPRKKEIGDRLAWLALEEVYGMKGLPFKAPTFRKMEVVHDELQGNIVILEFNNLETLWFQSNTFKVFEDGCVIIPKGFEIAGEDKKFYEAEAQFSFWDNKIKVWSNMVENPVAVRYAFKNWCPEANVVTTQGQPLLPFRTDNWQVLDVFKE